MPRPTNLSYLCFLIVCPTLPTIINSATSPRDHDMGIRGRTLSRPFTKVRNFATNSASSRSSTKISQENSAAASKEITRLSIVDQEIAVNHRLFPDTSFVKSSTIVKKPSVTLGCSTAGAVSFIQNVIAHSSGPIFRSITFGAQLAIAFYLVKVSCNVLKEVWDELNEEYKVHFKGGKCADVREEQDLPFADEDALSCEFNNEEDMTSKRDGLFSSQPKRYHSRPYKAFTPQMIATRELATRLWSTGIPYASELSLDSEDDCGIAYQSPIKPRTVESVIKSLTRSEGNVLSQTLLTTMDEGQFDVRSRAQPESDATEAWNAIGGLAEAKESLLDLVFPLLPPQSGSTPSDNYEHSKYYGGLLSNPPGVLLYGPPGCGKSMLVRALAQTVGARFLVVSPSCLLRKYVGETNLNVRALFSVARKISPTVIFVDELDGLFRERGGEDHDVGRDLKTEFLQLWDGIRRDNSCSTTGESCSSVLVIGATNRPFDVDPAFLRRMPRRVFVGLPDYDSRVHVLKNMLIHVPLEPSFDIGLVSQKTEGYSPSDIREVLQVAALYPLREARAAVMSTQHRNGDEWNKSVSLKIEMPPLRRLRTDDILRALESAKPTLMSKRYQKDLMEYVQNSGGTNGGFLSDCSSSPSLNDGFTSPDNQNDFDADGVIFRSENYNHEDNTEDNSYDESSSEDGL